MRRDLLVLVVAAALTVSLSARAAPPPKGAEAKDKAAAQKLLDEGNRLIGEGEYVEALARFRAAHARFPSAKLLLNIGTTLRQLGRNVEAAETYERYLTDPGADPKRVPEVRRVLGELDALVAYVRVVVTPADATVTLDGAALPLAARGVEVRIEPGTHKLVGEKKGLPPAVQTITLARGERRTVPLALIPLPVLKPASPLRTVGWGAGALGIAALGGGGAAGIVALVQKRHASEHCDVPSARCDATGASAANAAKAAATASTALFVTGGAALGAGIVLLATTRPAEVKIEPRVGFFAGPGGGALTLSGRW
jgi:hypothetical protein